MTIDEAIKYIEQHGFVSDEVKDMAIKALEKQIPKKPIWKPYEDDEEYGSYSCPCCDEWLVENYCAECGQAIDWS